MHKIKKNLSKGDYEDLGKMMQNIYESHYADRWRAYRMSFLKGVFGGLGGVIGATIVVAILAWVLSLFHYVPFLNRLTDNIQRTVETTEKP